MQVDKWDGIVSSERLQMHSIRWSKCLLLSIKNVIYSSKWNFDSMLPAFWLDPCSFMMLIPHLDHLTLSWTLARQSKSGLLCLLLNICGLWNEAKGRKSWEQLSTAAGIVQIFTNWSGDILLVLSPWTNKLCLQDYILLALKNSYCFAVASIEKFRY